MNYCEALQYVLDRLYFYCLPKASLSKDAIGNVEGCCLGGSIERFWKL